MNRQTSTRRASWLLGFASLVAGCTTLGPQYQGPPAVATPDRFARAPEAARADAGTKLDNWWTALGDPQLDDLVKRALASSPDLAVAQARLRRARAGLRLERANGMPSGSATALAAHARLPPISLGASDQPPEPTQLNLYSVGFDATWEIDLFGGRRRAVEAAGASAMAAEDNLANTQLSLTAEVAQAYVKLRDTQNRLDLIKQAIARQEQMLALTDQRVRGGTVSRLELVRQQSQLDSTKANAIPLDAQRDAYLDELATLTGQAPGALDSLLGSMAPVPMPPSRVEVGDPAALLQRRPDIRAAERQLAARTAAIGQVEAARFPKLTLLGLIGLGGTSPSDLTQLDNYSAILAPQLSWSFLDFGRSKARVEQADADRDEAEANYRKAVDDALRDAEDALSRFGGRRGQLAAIARAKASADDALELTRQRYTAGTASLIDLLDAERTQISAEQGLSQAKADLTSDYVSLQKALGLGWTAPASG